MVTACLIAVVGSAAPRTVHANADGSPPLRSTQLAFAVSRDIVKLNSSTVWEIEQDADGQIWFGSQSGLGLDTGSDNATTFEDPTSSGDVPIRGVVDSIAVDDSGGVWIADGTLKHVESWTNTITDTGLMATSAIKARDRIWTIAQGKVRLVSLNPVTVIAQAPIPVGRPRTDPIPAVSDVAGNLYLGGVSQLAIVSTTGESRTFNIPGGVTGIAARSDGGIWFASPSGVWTMSASMNSPSLIAAPPGKSGPAPGRALLEFMPGMLLLSADVGGLMALDVVTQTWSTPTGADPSRLGEILDLYLDGSGRLWASEQGSGPLRLRRPSEGFDRINLTTSGHRVDQAISWVAARERELWIARGTGPIERFDLETRRWTHPITFPPATTYGASVNVTSLAFSNDQLWIGTWGSGLFVAPTRGGTAQPISAPAGQFITSLAADGDRVWWSAWGEQIGAIDSRRRVTHSIEVPGRPGGFSNPDEPSDAAESVDAQFTSRLDIMPDVFTVDGSSLYAGGKGGLQILNLDTGTIKTYSQKNGLLGGSQVDAIFVESPDTVWVSTNAGLDRIAVNTQSTTRYGRKDGLPSGTINAIAPQNGEGGTPEGLWVAGSETLALIDLGSQDVIATYPGTYGLPEAPFNPAPPAVAADGTVYLGSASNVTVLPNFRPQNVQPTNAIVGVRCASQCSVIDGAVESDREPITVEFVSTDYDDAQVTDIEYRLVGGEEFWVPVDRDSWRLTLPELGAGTHTLLVRPVGDERSEVGEFRYFERLDVRIPTVWYRRGIVQGLCALLLLLVAGTAFVYRQALRAQRERALEETISIRTAQLEASRAEAEAANRAKDRFLMTVSHDLRNPLMGVIGYADILATTELDGDQRRMTTGIATAGHHLATLIEELLATGLGRQSMVDDPVEITDLGEVARSALAFVGARAETAGIALACEVDVIHSAIVDGRPLKHVLINLLSNAIVHSGGSRVELTITEMPWRPGSSRFLFGVFDNGGNLDPAEAPSLIDERYRGQRTSEPGHGLGLSLCNAWIAKHDSALEVDVAPGRSTRFRFELMLRTSPETVADLDTSDFANESLKSLRFVAVDDDEIIRSATKELAARAGLHMAVFATADDVIDYLETHAVEVVLSDIMMTPTNGIELARTIRRTIDPPPTIIAVSAVSKTAYTNGEFDAVIQKPLSLDKLCAALNSLDASPSVQRGPVSHIQEA